METVPAVAVVIPTYNRRSLLARAVISAAWQTRPPSEIIIVDDASTDGTNEIIAQLHPHIIKAGINLIYYRQAGRFGANAARNLGISLATAPLIAFLDSDDLWHEHKLEFQLHPSADLNGLHFSDRIKVDQDFRVISYGLTRDSVGEDTIRSKNKIGPLSSVILPRLLLKEIHGFDENLKACQDWDIYIRALWHTKAYRTPHPLVAYFDTNIPRISNNFRSRIIAHSQIKRRYANNLPPVNKSGYYLNVGSDLERLGRRRLSRKFLLQYYINEKKLYGPQKILSLAHYWRRNRKKPIHTNLQVPVRQAEIYYQYLYQKISRELDTMAALIVSDPKKGSISEDCSQS